MKNISWNRKVITVQINNKIVTIRLKGRDPYKLVDQIRTIINKPVLKAV